MADLTTDAVTGSLLVVPLGATEQHGPHLPLGTDTAIAVALASSLPEAVVAPALPYGSSGEHAGFTGTLSIGRPAFSAVVVELARSSSFPRVLFVSAHGGNAEPLAAAVHKLRKEGRDVRAWSPDWGRAAARARREPSAGRHAAPGDGGRADRDAMSAVGDAHAGRTETSLMLALAPQLVGAARPGGNVAPLSSLMPALRAGGVRAVSPNGVLGDAAGASAEEGRALLAAATADLAAFVAAWQAAAEPVP